jgi:hypothetical protein
MKTTQVEARAAAAALPALLRQRVAAAAMSEVQMQTISPSGRWMSLTCAMILLRGRCLDSRGLSLRDIDKLRQVWSIPVPLKTFSVSQKQVTLSLGGLSLSLYSVFFFFFVKICYVFLPLGVW